MAQLGSNTPFHRSDVLTGVYAGPRPNGHYGACVPPLGSGATPGLKLGARSFPGLLQPDRSISRIKTARTIGCKPGTVMSRLSRARATLRRAMGLAPDMSVTELY